MAVKTPVFPIIPNLLDVLQKHVTSKFGYREDPVSHVKKSYHGGVDFGIISYTPISAPWDFKVVDLGTNDIEGVHLILHHPDVNVNTGYCHLIKYSSDIVVGYTGKAGEVVAFSGNTGKCTKNAQGIPLAHLHFTLGEPDEKGSFHSVDPLPYLWSMFAEQVPEKIEPISLNPENIPEK